LGRCRPPAPQPRSSLILSKSKKIGSSG